MITEDQIKNLKEGDKLIFFRNGGTVSSNEGNVFTFSNWFKEHGELVPGYWQCKEILNRGNLIHNFDIYDTELFDKNIHKNYVLMNEKKLISEERKFIKDYGGF